MNARPTPVKWDVQTYQAHMNANAEKGLFSIRSSRNVSVGSVVQYYHENPPANVNNSLD